MAVEFQAGKRGNPQLLFEGYVFNPRTSSTLVSPKQLWYCARRRRGKCKALAHVKDGIVVFQSGEHNHVAPIHQEEVSFADVKATNNSLTPIVKEEVVPYHAPEDDENAPDMSIDDITQMPSDVNMLVDKLRQLINQRERGMPSVQPVINVIVQHLHALGVIEQNFDVSRFG
jgi:FLYWCH zinc finger domain